MTHRTSPMNQMTLGAIPSVTTADRIHALRRARALLPKPQRPMDIGLFGSDHDQLDLIDMLQDLTNAA